MRWLFAEIQMRADELLQAIFRVRCETLANSLMIHGLRYCIDGLVGLTMMQINIVRLSDGRGRGACERM